MNGLQKNTELGTKMSTTPRTDAARGFHDMDTAVSAEDMAQLETEFVHLRNENNLLKAAQKISEEMEEPFFREVLEARSILAAYDVAVATRNRLKTELEAMTARAELAEASAKLWEADALRYANNTEFWKDRAEKAEAECTQMRNAIDEAIKKVSK